MPEWNAEQYLKFERERTQPSIDLTARIGVTGPRRIVDIGCGPGNSSRVLAKAFPGANVLGVDNSPQMIDAARAACPELTFKLADVGGDLAALGGGFDIAFSNACLQWVAGHRVLIPRLLALLRPGGQLAVQIPMIEREPIHQIVNAVAGRAGWRGHFHETRLFHNLAPEEYFDLLAGHAARFDQWETVYLHNMTGAHDILEWYRGSGLRPYLQALPAEKQGAFEADVLEEITRAYPPRPGGRVIFRFPRLFFVATAG